MGIDNICFSVFFSKTQMPQGKELSAVEIFAEIYFFRFWTRKVMKFVELILWFDHFMKNLRNLFLLLKRLSKTLGKLFFAIRSFQENFVEAVLTVLTFRQNFTEFIFVIDYYLVDKKFWNCVLRLYYIISTILKYIHIFLAGIN